LNKISIRDLIQTAPKITVGWQLQLQINSKGLWSPRSKNGKPLIKKRFYNFPQGKININYSLSTKFQPKIFEDHDVDIVNECCGVCGSDVHTISGGWGEHATDPLCVGHEIIGKVLRVGSKVDQKRLKPGMRVGVGAQVQSCMQCENCKSGNENYCPKMVGMSALTLPKRLQAVQGNSS
jgi:threonine dehydrogenase-like Zn-dependent dehydrogenase